MPESTDHADPADASPDAPDASDAPAHCDVAVIGAGPAGTAAALRAAELGASVVVWRPASSAARASTPDACPARAREDRAARARGALRGRERDRRGRARAALAVDRGARARAGRPGALPQGRGRPVRGGGRDADPRGPRALRRRPHAPARQRPADHRGLDHRVRRRRLAPPARARRGARDRARGRARAAGDPPPTRRHRRRQHGRAARDRLPLVRLRGDAARRRAARAHCVRRGDLRGRRRRVRRAGRARAHRHRHGDGPHEDGRRSHHPALA